MCSRSVDLAIPSGPMASSGLTSGKAVLVVWLCDCRCLRVEGDPVCGTMQVLPDCRHRQAGRLVLVFASPNIGRCFIVPKHYSQPEAALADQSAAAFFRGPQGVDDGRLSHDPVTVVITQGVPIGLAGIGLVGPIPARAFAPLTMVSNPGAPGLVRRCRAGLVDETFLVQASSGRATPLDVIFVARLYASRCS